MSYQEALAGIGVRPTLDDHFGDYQGDWVAIVRDEGWYWGEKKIGFLVYGYGSCSGCDEWEAADNDPIERAQIVVRMASAIKWFDAVQDLRDYLNSDACDLSWYGDEVKDFLDKVRKTSDEDLLKLEDTQ